MSIISREIDAAKSEYKELNRDVPVRVKDPSPAQSAEEAKAEADRASLAIAKVEATRLVKEGTPYQPYDPNALENQNKISAERVVKEGYPNLDRKDIMLPRPTYDDITEFKNDFPGGTNYKPSTDKKTINIAKGSPDGGVTYGDSIQSHVGMMNNVLKKSGFGPIGNQATMWMRNIDRFQMNTLPPNYETSDITLISRPTLPMESSAIRHDSFLRMFDTTITDSLAFAIRCYLDKKWVENHTDLSFKCPRFNPYNPWLVPAVNGLTSISSFPDPAIETKTTEGGFHQEDQIYAKGGTGLNRGFQITLNFKDIQGGPLLLMFQAWIEIIAQLRDGRMMAYMDAINANVLPYTVSIYRFNLDPTKTWITNWCKVTTCFPLSIPLGGIMNTSENNRHISQSGVFSVPFACNFIQYNRLDTIRAFMALTERYYPFNTSLLKKAKTISPTPENNYAGIPYIEFSKKGLKFVYKEMPEF